jgi:hypothetical protein
MRKTLIGLAMLLAAACLAADDDPDQKAAKAVEKQPPFEAQQAAKVVADLQRALEARERELEAATNRQESINRKVGEENAEYKIRLAKMEAEHKVMLAMLEKEMLAAAEAVGAAQREVSRAAGDLNRHRARPGPGGMGGVMGGVMPRGDFGFPVGFGPGGGPGRGEPKAEAKAGPTASGPTASGPTADQKLDAILSKLEKMEARLLRLENAQRNRR